MTRVEQIPLPVPPEGWAVIKVSHVGICGTDLHIFVGAHPRAKGPLVMGQEVLRAWKGWSTVQMK